LNKNIKSLFNMITLLIKNYVHFTEL